MMSDYDYGSRDSDSGDTIEQLRQVLIAEGLVHEMLRLECARLALANIRDDATEDEVMSFMTRLYRFVANASKGM
jgi:hypothetical protein